MRLVRKLNYLTVTRPDSQCSESVFVSIEDYPFEGSNEDFKMFEESSRERASPFRSWTHQSNRLLRCRLAMVLFL